MSRTLECIFCQIGKAFEDYKSVHKMCLNNQHGGQGLKHVLNVCIFCLDSRAFVNSQKGLSLYKFNFNGAICLQDHDHPDKENDSLEPNEEASKPKGRGKGNRSNKSSGDVATGKMRMSKEEQLRLKEEKRYQKEVSLPTKAYLFGGG